VASGSNGEIIRTFILWYLSLAVYTLAVPVFNGMGRMGFSLLVTLFYEVIKLGILGYAIWAAVRFESFVSLVNLGMAFSGIAAALLLLFIARPGPFHLYPTMEMTQALRHGIILWLPRMSIVIYPQIMTILVNIGLSNKATSWFNTISSWSMAGFVLLSPVANAFFAWVAEKENISEDDNKGFANYFRILGGISFGIACLLFLVAPTLLQIYGSEFVALLWPFYILVAAGALEYPRFLTMPLFGARHEAKIALYLEVGRIVLIAFCTVIILNGGGTLFAVVWAILAIQFLTNIGRLAFLKSHYRLSLFWPYGRLVVAVVTCLVVLFLSPGFILSLAIFSLLFIGLSGFRFSDLSNFMPILLKGENE